MIAPSAASAVRLATLEDIPAMVALLAALFSIEADFQADPAKQYRGLQGLLQSPSARAWVAEAQGRTVGMVTLQVLFSTAEGGPVGLVEDLVVSHAWRGRGLGQHLLFTAEAWAREQGLTRLQLLADKENAPALAFYRSRGWSGTQLVALRKSLC